MRNVVINDKNYVPKYKGEYVDYIDFNNDNFTVLFYEDLEGGNATTIGGAVYNARVNQQADDAAIFYGDNEGE